MRDQTKLLPYFLCVCTSIICGIGIFIISSILWAQRNLSLTRHRRSDCWKGRCWDLSTQLEHCDSSHLFCADTTWLKNTGIHLATSARIFLQHPLNVGVWTLLSEIESSLYCKTHRVFFSLSLLDTPAGLPFRVCHWSQISLWSLRNQSFSPAPDSSRI